MVTLFCVNNESLSKPANISVGDMTEMAQKSEREICTFLTDCPIYKLGNSTLKVSCINTPDYKWLIVVTKSC
jgi:hypothetical protein